MCPGLYDDCFESSSRLDLRRSLRPDDAAMQSRSSTVLGPALALVPSVAALSAAVSNAPSPFVSLVPAPEHVRRRALALPSAAYLSPCLAPAVLLSLAPLPRAFFPLLPLPVLLVSAVTTA